MKQKGYFTKQELGLWLASGVAILLSFILFDRTNYVTLTASFIGITSLIFNAKGNPFGQLLMIIFSLLYGVISYSFQYYGEMFTYLGMTMPMSAFALVSWLRNPYKGKRSVVKVNRISRAETLVMIGLTVLVTYIFYWVLAAFHTTNFILSTVSVTTSFLAVYLTFRRSPYFAIAYAANDIVLIGLWLLAAKTDSSYLAVTVCFTAFFANDVYGYINWRRMEKSQAA